MEAVISSFKKRLFSVFADRHFLSANAVMFGSVMVAYFFAFLYQLVVARKLDPLDFGAFNVLLSILVILTVPLGALQTFVAKVVSQLSASNRLSQCRFFISRMLRNVFFIGVLFVSIAFLLSPRIASFLHLESFKVVLILFAILFFYFLLPVNKGCLQGLESFLYLGSVQIFHSLSRFVIGIILIFSFTPGDSLALSAYGIAVSLTFIMSYFLLRRALLEHNIRGYSSISLQELSASVFLNYFLKASLGFFSFMMLTNVDMVLVKHFFSSYDAGIYAFAQLMGRIILLCTSSICIVMFPVAKRMHVQRKDSIPLLKKSLLAGVVLSVTAAVIFLLFPQFIFRVIVGRVYPEGIVLVKVFSLSMGVYSILNIFLFYYLALEEFRLIYVFTVFAVLLVILVSIFHGSLLTVLLISLSVSIVLLVFNVIFIFGLKAAV